jgi:arsenate reductase
MDSGQKCPIFPLTRQILDWNLPDPNEFEGTEEEKLVQIRALRDSIKNWLRSDLKFIEIWNLNRN